MEIKYIRDLDHNYLVMAAVNSHSDNKLQQGEYGNISERISFKNRDSAGDTGFCGMPDDVCGGQERVFAEKMFLSHTPEGMIGFEIRIRNHEPHLFYKVDSLVSLSNRTLTSKLSRKEMHELLQALCLAQEALAEYLLDADKLFLSLDTVFTNPSTRRWYFLCYPYLHEKEGSLELFLEALTGVIGTADDDAVSEAYALCEMAGRKNGRLRDMMKELRQTYDVDEDCSAPACNPCDYGETDDCLTKQAQESNSRSYRDSFGYGTEPSENRANNRRDLYHEMEITAQRKALNQNGQIKKNPETHRESRNEIRHFGRKEIEKNTSIKRKRAEIRGYGRRQKKESENRDKSYLIITLLFIVVMLIPVYIRKEYVLSEAANIACSVIIGLCAAGAVGSLLLERRAKEAEYDEDDEEDDDEADDLWGRDELCNEDIMGNEKYYQRENDYRNKLNTGTAACNHQTALSGARINASHVGRGKTGSVLQEESTYTKASLFSKAEQQRYNPYSKMFAKREDEEARDDCTVLLTNADSKRAPKLYGRNQAASTNIVLEHLPLTLGSLGGSVDYKLGDKSVSRMHAYIGKNETGRVFLKDLGSTNGTYLNGKRLDSNEVTYLNSGDEVRFGALEFEYI